MVNRSLVGQRIYLDASALIYGTEVPEQYQGLRTKVFLPFALGQLTLVTSWITLTEVLVRPLQVGDVILENTYRDFLKPSSLFEIVHVDKGISDQAANLRVLHGFKVPDAIHIATGMTSGCTHYLTGDAKWAQTGLPVIQAANL